jgi:hypothetical protein
VDNLPPEVASKKPTKKGEIEQKIVRKIRVNYNLKILFD